MTEKDEQDLQQPIEDDTADSEDYSDDERPTSSDEWDEPVAPPKEGAGTIGAAWKGALGGMLLFVIMFIAAAYQAFDTHLLQGRSYSLTLVSEIYRSDYFLPILLHQIKILGAYLLLGGGLGAFFGFVGGGFYKKELQKSGAACFVSGLVGAAMIQVAAVLYALGNAPAVYSQYFNEQGAPYSFIQDLAVTVLIPPVMKVVIILLFIGPLFTVARRISRKAGPILLVVLLIACAGFCTYIHRYAPPPEFAVQKDRPNILIITADSLRPDKISVYNNSVPAGISTNIDALAKDGYFISENISPVARSLPALATLLTGQYPHTHGVRSMFPDPGDRYIEDSLAGEFKKLGYRTAAFAGRTGDGLHMIDAGFDHVDAPDFTLPMNPLVVSMQAHWPVMPYLDNCHIRDLFPILDWIDVNENPGTVTDRLVRFIDQQPDEPWLTVAYYSATGFPQAARYPYYDMYTSSEYEGAYKYRNHRLEQGQKIEPADAVHVAGLYDGALASFDNQVGRLIEALKKRGLYQGTIIILTGLYGQNLYEYKAETGTGNHFRSLADNSIPMVIKWPRGFSRMGQHKSGGKVNTLASIVDVAPTLYGAFKIRPDGPVDGLDLAPAVAGVTWKQRDVVFAETGIWYGDILPEYFEDRRIHYGGIDQLLARKGDLPEIDFYSPLVVKHEYKDLVDIARHRLAFDGRYKLVYMPTEKGVLYECIKVVRENGLYVDAAQASESKCDSLKAGLHEWLASGVNIEMRNELALPAN